MNRFSEAIKGGWGSASPGATRRRWAEYGVLAVAHTTGLLGDALIAFGILRATYIVSHGYAFDQVVSLLYAALGTAIFIGALAYNGIYEREFLLDVSKQTLRVIEAWLASSILFFGATVVFGETLVSLPYAFASDIVLLFMLLVWRVLLKSIMRSDSVTRRLRQRIIVLGWSESVAQLTRQSWEDAIYPCEIIGYVDIGEETEELATLPTIPCLGTKEHLFGILQAYQVDTAFMAGTDVTTDKALELACVCQREMVEFKVIPHCFPALASGMHVEWVAGVPILGTDRLLMNRLHIRMEKRVIDILGAIVGLLLVAPIVGLFAALVYWESSGPVFYRQIRLGRKGQPFEMFKIRSMRLDAEKDGKAGWTVANDPRRLKIGEFMRRWNIDELPQFWNVLIGDMSLVGPRPERPELISNLKHEIVHYNLRHSVKPGLTGWAQVNGLRGDTNLSERIQYDLFYIDNWSALLDIKTMILTVFKYKNAC